MNDPSQALAFAVEKYPERVTAVPVHKLLMESARQNDKRPAYAKIAMHDDTVKSLRGSPDKSKDLVLLVTIPNEILERSESRIILPGEV